MAETDKKSERIKFLNFLLEKKIDFVVNFQLKRNSWIKAGGIFNLYIQPNNFSKIDIMMNYMKDKSLDYYTIGNISNTIFRDGNITTPIINLKKFSIIEEFNSQKNLFNIKVSAGVNIYKFSNYISKKLSCSGAEGLVGIPGTVGGGIFMNASSYESEVTNYLVEVKYFDENYNLVTKKKQELNLSWRKSIFQSFKKCLIVEAIFEIPKKNKINSEIIEKKINSCRRHRDLFQEKKNPNLGSLFATKDLYRDIKSTSLFLFILYCLNNFFTKLFLKFFGEKGLIFYRKFLVKSYEIILGLDKNRYISLSTKTINCVVNLGTQEADLIIDYIKNYEKKINYAQSLENIIKDKIK
jgi:UDP-N-acetylmuramate dehydrogenase